MAKCWTCGNQVNSFMFTCDICRSISVLKEVNNNLSNQHITNRRLISRKFDELNKIQEEGFSSLRDALSSGLAEIASAIQWGFNELNWYIHQQTEILSSIDHTLKTPSQTKANEWRTMAEELRRRGVLDESVEFFLKALIENRLDYRIYIGLSETYLRMNDFINAKKYLEKSLPHAPKKEIDYKSYTYRLLGHVEYCNENYEEATKFLSLSIELSPNYSDAYYDISQYYAQIMDVKNSLNTLNRAILDKDMYYYLAQKENNYNVIRNEVDKLLSNILNTPKQEIETIIKDSESILEKASSEINHAREHNKHFRKSVYNNHSENRLIEAKSKIVSLKDKIATNDYVTILEAKPISEECLKSCNSVLEYINRYKNYKVPKRKLNLHIYINWGAAIPNMFLFGILGWFITGFVTCTIRVASGSWESEGLFSPYSAYTSEGVWGLIICGIIGFLIGSRKY